MTGTVEIPLSRGAVAIVDEDDYENLVSMGKWYLSDTGYAVMRTRVNGTKRTIRMHRVVNKTPDGTITDHLNRNPLDNRKANLRTATFVENNNNKKFTKGYTWDKSKEKWLVRYKGQFYGRYDSESEAQAAYKLARSGVVKPSSEHPRRKYLPRGVSYMQPNAAKNPYYIRITINGKRHFKGYFSSVAEAVIALNNFEQQGGITP